MDGDLKTKRSPERIDKVVLARRQTSGSKQLALLLEAITALAATDFTGYMKINFTQGGIGRVEKCEEILKIRNNSSF